MKTVLRVELEYDSDLSQETADEYLNNQMMETFPGVFSVDFDDDGNDLILMSSIYSEIIKG